MFYQSSVAGRRIGLLVIICLAVFTLLHVLSTCFFRQQYTLSPIIFPALTLFLIVFHTIVACFMVMKYVCDPHRLYLMPITCAFIGSSLMMLGTLGSYPGWFLCDGTSQINYNDAAIFFFFRNITMALLFNVAVILYHFRRRDMHSRKVHLLLLGIMVLFTGKMVAMAWTWSSASPLLSVQFIDNLSGRFTPLWEQLMSWLLVGLWLLTLLLLVFISRLRNIFWYSGAFFCIAYMLTLSILLTADNSEAYTWYHARLLETAATLFIIFVLLCDIFTLYRMSHKKYLESYQNAIRDPLTRLYNRSYFYDALTQILPTVSVHQPVSIIVSDLDHFKRINDTFGHLLGDKVIQFTAGVLQRSSRRNDVAARIGGEEFALLLASTHADDAAIIAERIRQTIAQPDEPNGCPPVTISMGVFTATSPALTAEFCVQQADEAMYEAKETGRNRVVCRG